MRLLRYGGDKRARRAFEERQALVKAGLTRRDLVKMGILTGGGIGGGLLMADRRSSTALGALPPLTPFVEPLTVLPALPSRSASELGTGTTAPTSSPYRAINPANNMPYEGRSEAHQSRDSYPVAQYLMTRMAANPNVSIHPNLPSQTFWGFNQGGADLTADPAMSPGPVLVMRYGSPVLIRRFNALPPPEQNGGFGVPDVSTHLHNFHSGPESDGAPCDPTQHPPVPQRSRTHPPVPPPMPAHATRPMPPHPPASPPPPTDIPAREPHRHTGAIVSRPPAPPGPA